jgi:Restriction endonuclease BamHI
VRISDKYFALEWETGNISSTHRSLTRMALGLTNGALIGGMLILPTRALYNYLTDRVGNYREIEPYFPLWRSIKIDEGFFGVMAIEHDTTDKNSPRIKKGTNGRARG